LTGLALREREADGGEVEEGRRSSCVAGVEAWEGEAGGLLGMSNSGVQEIGAGKRCGGEVSVTALLSCSTIAQPTKRSII
jgi:hypothetical protein